MKKYFVKKDGKFLKTVLELDSKAYPAETNAEEWVSYEQRKNPGSTYELLSIIRETKKGQKYINKVLDYQNDSVAEYVGFESAKQYTDDEIKEFFRNCWYS